MTISIPLNKLDLSPENVRKTNGEEDIPALAADIKARGLKQNLVVKPSAKGRYEVDAGGRRLRALLLLAAEGDIPHNHPVMCLVEAADQALETSLAENIHKVAMNPADEAEAFALIIARYGDSGITDRGEQIANCARRFGVTERHVTRRLQLAALPAPILDALRDGTITLDAARAYCTHPDPDQQLKVFEAEQKRIGWGHSPKTIRDALKGKTYLATDPRCLLVGEQAYLAAGGRITADIFMEADEWHWLDTALVDDLFAKAAEQAATLIAKDEGYAGGMMMANPLDQYWPHPPAPEGYAVTFVGTDRDALAAVAPEVRANRIALYFIDSEAKLQQAAYAFETKPEPAASTGSAHAETTGEARNAAAADRLYRIEDRAVHLALPRFDELPWADHVTIPQVGQFVGAIEVDDNDDFLVCIRIRVPRAEVEARMAEAELEVAAEEQSALAAAARAQCEKDPEEGAPADPPIDPGVNDSAQQEQHEDAKEPAA